MVAIDNAEQLLPEPCAALRGMFANANEPGGTLLHCVLLANPEHCAPRTPAAGWVQATRPRIELAPMLARELQRYVEARLENAGWGGGELFSEGGLDVIHRLSGGIPRAANRICEQALVQAARTGQRSIDGELIESLGVRPRPPLGSGTEATEPILRTPQSRRSPQAQDDPLPADRPAAEGESVTGDRQHAHAPNTNVEPDGELPTEHRGVPPSASEADPERRTRLWPPAALSALASRVPWNWKLPAALVGGVAAVLLVNHVVTLSGGEGPGSTPIEPREGAAEPPPRDPSQPSPALTPLRDWAVDPWGAPSEPTDTRRQGASEPMATFQEVHPPGNRSSDGTEVPLGASTDAAEPTAATESPPRPPTPTAASGSSDWLDHLDVSLDAPPTGSATRTPTLALPEPDLARRLSPAGASATK